MDGDVGLWLAIVMGVSMYKICGRTSDDNRFNHWKSLSNTSIYRNFE